MEGILYMLLLPLLAHTSKMKEVWIVFDFEDTFKDVVTALLLQPTTSVAIHVCKPPYGSYLFIVSANHQDHAPGFPNKKEPLEVLQEYNGDLPTST